MANDNRREVKLKKEMRTKEISKMIGEGGLGAEEYYEIEKPSPSPQYETEGEQHENEAKTD